MANATAADATSVLLAEFSQRNYATTIEDETTILVSLTDKTRGRLNITTWLNSAVGKPIDEVRELAAAYVDQTVELTLKPREVFKTPPENIRLRVYPDEALSGMKDTLLTRQLAPGLLETVVLDFPDSTTVLNRSEIAEGAEKEFFGAALSHSIGKEESYSQVNEIHGIAIFHIGGQHRYVSAHVHVLARYIDRNIAPLGALISLPVPEYLIVHPIGDTHIFSALDTFQELTRRFFEDGDKAISPQVFWWRPSDYEQLPETEALYSGMMPILLPVGIRIDHQDKSVFMKSQETNELIDLWMNKYNSGTSS